MKSLVLAAYKSSFFRSLLALASGTAAAQVITFGLTPIITRIYAPNALGIQGAFNSLTSIAAPAIALAYPMAIVLQQNKQDISYVIAISAALTALISAVIGSLFLIFSLLDLNARLFGGLADYIYMAPLYLALAGINQISLAVLIKEKKYKAIALSSIINAAILGVTKIAAGIFYPEPRSLLFAIVFSYFLYTISLTRQAIKIVPFPPGVLEWHQLRARLLAHRDFPLFRAPQLIINAIGIGLPVLMMASTFDNTTVGHFVLAVSVLAIPTQLIGKSVADVVYPRVVELLHNGKSPKRILIQTSAGLLIVGALPLLILIFAGPQLFVCIFGAEWAEAGQYARIIAVGQIFHLAARPSVAATPVLKIQPQLLLIEVFGACIRVGGFLTAVEIFPTAAPAIASLTMANVTIYSAIILIAWKRSKEL